MNDFVVVAQAAKQAEAELIQGLLQAVDVPSLVRRSAGFDVPDFLAAGPRDRRRGSRARGAPGK